MEEIDLLKDLNSFKVDITIKQRTGKKYTTYIANFPEKYDLPKILKYIKKVYKCGGSIIKDKVSSRQVIQLSGDQRQNVYDFFIKYNVLDKENIDIHGF